MYEKIDVLLAEGNPSDTELTIKALRKNKIINALLHLQDGEDALDYIFATGKYADGNMDDIPNIILFDLKMPKIDGLEVLTKIKSDQRTKIIIEADDGFSKKKEKLTKNQFLLFG